MKKHYVNKVRKAKYGYFPAVEGRVSKRVSRESPIQSTGPTVADITLADYEEQRRNRVYALIKRGESVEDVARLTGVTVAQLRKIISGR